jgi:uncharacterized protein YdhG (YjbR/CyaY superfamily)
MKYRNPDVDKYLKDLDGIRRSSLSGLRDLIAETIPEIHETMKYRMPTYELSEMVCAFASQKHYMSLYMDQDLIEKYRDRFGKLNVGKSCIRFKKLSELPLEVIKAILVETVQKQKLD